MTAQNAAQDICVTVQEDCRLPVLGLSEQTRHIVDNHHATSQRSNRMLSLFVVILSLALATVLGLLVVTSPVNAMSIPPQPDLDVAEGFIALTAIGSLAASVWVGIVLVRTQLAPAKNRKR